MLTNIENKCVSQLAVHLLFLFLLSWVSFSSSAKGKKKYNENDDCADIFSQYKFYYPKKFQASLIGLLIYSNVQT